MSGKPRRVAIAGFGAIGGTVARRLDQGMAGLELAAVSARRVEEARGRMASFARPVPVVPLGELAGHADVIVECAPAAVFRQVAEPALRAGRLLMPASVGALLQHWDLVEIAEGSGGRISGLMPCVRPPRARSARSA
jgi:aspartate dehydrogenase